MDIEDYMMDTRAAEDLTKMALARQLQKRDRLSSCSRDSVWSSLSKVELFVAWESTYGYHASENAMLAHIQGLIVHIGRSAKPR